MAAATISTSLYDNFISNKFLSPFVHFSEQGIDNS